MSNIDEVVSFSGEVVRRPYEKVAHRGRQNRK
jgi:hypothetical protein